MILKYFTPVVFDDEHIVSSFIHGLSNLLTLWARFQTQTELLFKMFFQYTVINDRHSFSTKPSTSFYNRRAWAEKILWSVNKISSCRVEIQKTNEKKTSSRVFSLAANVSQTAKVELRLSTEKLFRENLVSSSAWMYEIFLSIASDQWLFWNEIRFTANI